MKPILPITKFKVPMTLRDEIQSALAAAGVVLAVIALAGVILWLDSL